MRVAWLDTTAQYLPSKFLDIRTILIRTDYLHYHLSLPYLEINLDACNKYFGIKCSCAGTQGHSSTVENQTNNSQLFPSSGQTGSGKTFTMLGKTAVSAASIHSVFG